MKRIGKIKKVSVLGLIFLLSINSFATSISNNDGSAFITKAEFDALKSQFQAQIDTYNQGIDSKIDVAIATYLSGIKITTEPENIYDKVKSALGTDLWFKNDIPAGMGGTSSIDSQFTLNLTRRFYYKYWDNLISGYKLNASNGAFKYSGSSVVDGTSRLDIWVENLFKAEENAQTNINNTLMGQGHSWKVYPVDVPTTSSGNYSIGENALDNM